MRALFGGKKKEAAQPAQKNPMETIQNLDSQVENIDKRIKALDNQTKQLKMDALQKKRNKDNRGN